MKLLDHLEIFLFFPAIWLLWSVLQGCPKLGGWLVQPCTPGEVPGRLLECWDPGIQDPFFLMVKFATKYLKSTTRQYWIRWLCYFHWKTLFLPYCLEYSKILSYQSGTIICPFFFCNIETQVVRAWARLESWLCYGLERIPAWKSHFLPNMLISFQTKAQPTLHLYSLPSWVKPAQLNNVAWASSCLCLLISVWYGLKLVKMGQKNSKRIEMVYNSLKRVQMSQCIGII